MKTFLYVHTADLAVARGFYSDVVGLAETWASDEVVGYVVGSMQLTISKHDDHAVGDGWSRQLGWSGGTASVTSWGFELPDDVFGAVVRRALACGVETQYEEPRWVGYWSFPMRDPMGNTVEVSASGDDAWPVVGASS